MTTKKNEDRKGHFKTLALSGQCNKENAGLWLQKLYYTYQVCGVKVAAGSAPDSASDTLLSHCPIVLNMQSTGARWKFASPQLCAAFYNFCVDAQCVSVKLNIITKVLIIISVFIQWPMPDNNLINLANYFLHHFCRANSIIWLIACI